MLRSKDKTIHAKYNAAHITETGNGMGRRNPLYQCRGGTLWIKTIESSWRYSPITSDPGATSLPGVLKNSNKYTISRSSGLPFPCIRRSLKMA